VVSDTYWGNNSLPIGEYRYFLYLKWKVLQPKHLVVEIKPRPIFNLHSNPAPFVKEPKTDVTENLPISPV